VRACLRCQACVARAPPQSTHAPFAAVAFPVPSLPAQECAAWTMPPACRQQAQGQSGGKGTSGGGSGSGGGSAFSPAFVKVSFAALIAPGARAQVAHRTAALYFVRGTSSKTFFVP